MSTQLLTPFKAKFVLSTKTSIYSFFEKPDEVEIKQKYNAVKDHSENVDMVKFIKYHCISFTSYRKYKLLGLNYHRAFDVHPENVLTDNEKDYELHFKLESSPVEVLQIVDGIKITFSNFANEICTIELDDNLKLFKF